jgi:hypothetical protein
MMSSSTRTSASLPKSTTIGPRVRRSLMTNRWKESRLMPLLDGGLGCNTSSRSIEFTSSYTLVFFPLLLAALSLAFCSNLSFHSTSLNHVFSIASFTFSPFFQFSAFNLLLAFFQVQDPSQKIDHQLLHLWQKAPRTWTTQPPLHAHAVDHTPSTTLYLEDVWKIMS